VNHDGFENGRTVSAIGNPTQRKRSDRRLHFLVNQPIPWGLVFSTHEVEDRGPSRRNQKVKRETENRCRGTTRERCIAEQPAQKIGGKALDSPIVKT
jgi:hypothetical protein